MLSENNAVVFKVAGTASKPEIKAAVEALFNVKRDRRQHDRHQGQDQEVEGRSPTSGRTSKKAIVTLAEGQSIDITKRDLRRHGTQSI